MSDSNLSVLALARETAWGVLAAPSLKKYRSTKESFEHEKSTVKSATIRDDRQTDESIEVGVQAGGGFDFELHVGDEDALLESAVYGTWAGDKLFNGVTRTSYLIEKQLASGAFVSFPGMMIDGMTLNFNSRQIVTGTVSFLGKQGVPGATSVSGSYAVSGTGLALSASANVGNISIDGAPISSVKSVSITLANNARGNNVIGQKGLDAIGLGEFGVTGKLELYFKTLTLFQDLVNHAVRKLSWEVTREAAGAISGDVVGYRFTIPALHFPKGTPTVTGKNTDIMLPLDFDAQAIPAATDPSHTLKIEHIKKT